MARPKGSHDISPMIRGAFIRAAKALESKGKPLSTIIMQELEKDPLATIRTMASFVPKELDITQRKISDISELSDEELEQLKSLAASIVDGAGTDSEEESADKIH